MNSTICICVLTAVLSTRAQAALSIIPDTSSGGSAFGSHELRLSGGFSRYDLTPSMSYVWTGYNTNNSDYELEPDTVSRVERDRRGVTPKKSWTYPADAADTEEGTFSFTVEYKF